MVVARLLRLALIADAVATAGTGLLMFTMGNALEPVLGIPAALSTNAGLGLLPYAAIVGYLGSRTRIPQGVVWAVVGGNVAWAVASLAALLTQWIDATTLGYVFVIGQAAVVAVFAELQYLGLRRSTAAPRRHQARVAAA